MYLQTSRLQYNSTSVQFLQKAYSVNNIQAEACDIIIAYIRQYFNTV